MLSGINLFGQTPTSLNVGGVRDEATSNIAIENLNPYLFGAKGDSTTIDDAAFVAMFNYVSEKSSLYSKVYIKKGKYRLTTKVTGLFGSQFVGDFKIEGEPGATIISEHTSQVFEFLGKQTNLTLLQSGIEGNSWVRASGQSGLKVGALVSLANSVVAETGWNYPTYDTHVVLKKGGDTIYFRENLNFSYPIATMLSFYYSNKARFSMSGIDFILGANNGTPILIKNTIGGEFRNLNFRTLGTGTPQQVAFQYYANADASFENIDINGITYGVDVSLSRNCYIRNIKGSNCYGLVVPAAWSDGIWTDGLVGNNVSLDGHPSFNVGYRNVRIKNGGLAVRSSGVTIEDAEIETNSIDTFVLTSMSGPFVAPYVHKNKGNVTTIRNLTVASKLKSAAFNTSSDTPTEYRISGLTANKVEFDLLSTFPHVSNIKAGFFRSRNTVRVQGLILDKSLSPTWRTGFINKSEGGIIVDNLKTVGGQNMTLFTDLNLSTETTFFNSKIDSIKSIRPNGTPVSTINYVRLINSAITNSTLTDEAFLTKNNAFGMMAQEVSFVATSGQTNFTIPLNQQPPTDNSIPVKMYRGGMRLKYTSGSPTTSQFTYSGNIATTFPSIVGDEIIIEYTN